MKQRVVTGFIFGLLFIPGIILGGIYFFCISLIITYVSTFELMNMFYKKNESLKTLRFIVPVFSALFCTSFAYSTTKDVLAIDLLNSSASGAFLLGSNSLSTILGNYAITALIGLLFIIVLGAIAIFCKNPGRTAIHNIFSFVYGGVLLSSALGLENVYSIDEENCLFQGATFAYLYTVVCFSDMFAYFSGYLFGKHKLCPTISPKKTVEGAIGGTLMAACGGTLVAILFSVMPWDASFSGGEKALIIGITFVLSILISIISQLGDLFASVLKREYEIKDYGNILPGHGGILDRFDSTALAGSFFFVVLGLIKLFVVLF